MAEIVTGPLMFIGIVQDRIGVIRASFTDTSQHVFGVEGVHWIRGHHDPDSEEVRALLVAYAIEHNG